MNVFEAVKENITARKAAEWYGFKVSRNGMMKCPFHKDKTPSMKIDRRYYCFGCLETGDVIDFIAKLYDLTKKEAALKLADDFGLSYEKRWAPGKTKAGIPMVKRAKFKTEKDIEDHFWLIITDYYHLLCNWKQKYKQKDPAEEPDPRYVEAVRNMTMIEYVMDSFLEGDASERELIVEDYEKRIKEFEKRISDSGRDKPYE